MSTLWFTSDAHFKHDYVAQIRGFSSTGDHDEALIKNLNSAISPGDTVFFLGDFSLKKPDQYAEYLARLNGDWHLITGNHDYAFPGHRDSHKYFQATLDAGFKTVQPFARRKMNGQNVLLSHFPYGGDHTPGERYSQYRLRNEGLPILHGHTHLDQVISYSKARKGIFRRVNALQIHVGLDAWNLFPVSVDEIVKEIEANTL